MIKIRKASVKDILVIFNLWKNLVKEHNEMILQKSPELKPLLATKKNVADIYKKDAKKALTSKKGAIFIAETGRKPVGYIELTINKRSYSIMDSGIICDIFVKKEFRKLGVSSRLKEEAINWFKLKKIKYIWLNVQIYNEHAYSVYRKWGFSDSDRRMMKKL